MENNLDAWTQELRESGCCLSWFTLKVKALEILRELGQFDGKDFASDGWLLHTAWRTIISTRESKVDNTVPAHKSDDFDSFNSDSLYIFEENENENFIDENDNKDDSYVSEEDEVRILF